MKDITPWGDNKSDYYYNTNPPLLLFLGSFRNSCGRSTAKSKTPPQETSFLKTLHRWLIINQNDSVDHMTNNYHCLRGSKPESRTRAQMQVRYQTCIQVMFVSRSCRIKIKYTNRSTNMFAKLGNIMRWEYLYRNVLNISSEHYCRITSSIVSL